MSAMNFNTTNAPFRQLLGNGMSYCVPPFQRDYSWEEEQWDDLWQDILSLFSADGDSDHYMGYLVLQTDDNKRFNVIDGQQRLTTISLLILAALTVFRKLAEQGIDPERNKQRFEHFRASYIGYVDPVSLVSRPKLTLNRQTDDFFQTKIVPLVVEANPRNRNASEKQLLKAFLFFCGRLEKKFAGASADTNAGEMLASFLEKIVDRLLFTRITVSDELNAFKVFETLNARGVRLSSTDLVKNYLFSVVDATSQNKNDEIKALEMQWARIIDNLDGEDFPMFLRVFWNSQNKNVSKSNLFKALRRQIESTQNVFELLRGLDECSGIYAALCAPEADEYWNGKEKDALSLLKRFSVRQPLPALLSCYRRFFETQREDFGRILNAVVVLSFRYNIIGELNPNDLEGMYNAIACNVMAGKCVTAREVIALMQENYPDDEMFKVNFAKKVFPTNNQRNSKIVRYILHKLEQRWSGTSHDMEDAVTTLEHILPENPSDAWVHITDAIQGRMVFRLGNMTLLEAKKNRDLQNFAYSQKRPVYAESKFKVTQTIAEAYDIWDEAAIESRQMKMAMLAKSVWQISF